MTRSHIDLQDNYHVRLKELYKDYLYEAKGKAKDDPRIIANQMKTSIIEAARRYGTSFVVADLEAAIADVKAEQQVAAADNAIAQLKFDPSVVTTGNEQLEAYLQILLYRPATAAEKAVIKQFLWLIKRHLINKPASHHIMPVIVGAQGSGKTETIKKLIQGSGLPDDLILATNFSYLEDERNTPALSKHYIVFLDEMAKASRSDVNNLKRLITESVLTYRPMRTNEERKLKNNVTLIGASNQSIMELIKDYTGMRRYYELIVADVSAFTLAEKNERWKKLSEIDFKSIWRSIDEEASMCNEFVDMYEQINAVQTEQLAASNMFLEFCDSAELTPYKEGKRGNHAMIDVLKDYKEFLQEHGSYADGGIDTKGLARKFRDAKFETGYSNGKFVVFVQSGKKKSNKIDTGSSNG